MLLPLQSRALISISEKHLHTTDFAPAVTKAKDMLALQNVDLVGFLTGLG